MEDFRYIFYALNFRNSPLLKTYFDQQKQQRSLKITPHKRADSGHIVSDVSGEYFSGSSIDTRLEIEAVDGLSFETTIKEADKPANSYTSHLILENTYTQTPNFTIDKPSAYQELMKGVFLFPNLPVPGLDSRLEKLMVRKAHHPIIEVLQSIDPAIQSISLGTNGMVYFDIGIDQLIPVGLAGDGIRRVLSTLVAIADSPNGIILIDEIDNGLHYSSQATLMKALLQAAETYNVQIFATTHNYETLRKLIEVLQEKDMARHREHVKVITLRRTENHSAKAYYYDYEKFHFAIEQEIEIR